MFYCPCLVHHSIYFFMSLRSKNSSRGQIMFVIACFSKVQIYNCFIKIIFFILISLIVYIYTEAFSAVRNENDKGPFHYAFRCLFAWVWTLHSHWVKLKEWLLSLFEKVSKTLVSKPIKLYISVGTTQHTIALIGP